MKRQSGEEFYNYKNQLQPPKKMLEPCKANCRFKCRKRLEEKKVDRKEIFKQFWSTDSNSRKWDFISRCIIISKKKLQPCFVALHKSLTWNMFTKLNLHLNRKIEISKSLKLIN